MLDVTLHALTHQIHKNICSSRYSFRILILIYEYVFLLVYRLTRCMSERNIYARHNVSHIRWYMRHILLLSVGTRG